MTMIDKIATNMKEAVIFDVTENSMQMFRIYARIALETLKEPTEEMLTTVSIFHKSSYGTYDNWQRMIEAALKG